MVEIEELVAARDVVGRLVQLSRGGTLSRGVVRASAVLPTRQAIAT
jgi:hypothetical protein